MLSYCQICKMSVGTALDMTFHEKGKKHLKNIQKMKMFNGSSSDQNKEPNESKESTKSNDSQGKSDSGFERNFTSFKKAFDSSTVGTAGDDVIIKKRHEISNVKENAVFHRTQTFWSLENQSKRKLTKEDPGTSAKTDVPSVQLNYESDFDQQVDSLISQIEMTDFQRQEIQKVLRDIIVAFRWVLPSFTPLLYGSSLTNLAFKTSDIDVYICLNNGCSPDPKFVQKNGKSLYKYGLFRNVIRIPRARVPVIKAVHVETGMALDISLTSGLSLTNSLLIRFLQTAVPRLRKLLMIIAFWAKSSNIISVSRFSRYAINLMTFFYLQNRTPPVLPPLKLLLNEVYEDPWPISFKEDYTVFTIDNTTPLSVLFIDFFLFYSEFDFQKFFICCYLGKAIDKRDFVQNEKKYFDQMPGYKHFIQRGGERLKIRDVCVQDPFELNHNTSKQITLKALKYFQDYCRVIISIKNSFNDSLWFREIINKQKAVIEEKAPEFCFDLKLSINKENWKTEMKKDIETVLQILKFKIDWDLPLENKRPKTNNYCLSMILENQCHPTSRKFKEYLTQLRNGSIGLKEYSTLTEGIYQSLLKDDPVPIFCASCEVNMVQPNKFHFRLRCMKKDIVLFRDMGRSLAQYLPILFQALHEESKSSVNSQKICTPLLSDQT